ncbi:uncharacterized protein LOC129286524 [Prosopis cineraria]|uniref:uncharacterized protein LOC129286524 n=1 Tax=Prosopis cineraria TaxID=364024 RepID=UPI00240FDC9C|nr:uncharacterized protein LOC129286524 [Prosopis cineraria]
MSTYSIGENAPTSHRRRDLDLDLNRAPLEVNMEQEGPQVENRQVVQQSQFFQPIDVDAIIDDDVIESTQSDFLEAKNNSRRNRGRTIVDVDLDNVSRVAEITPNNHRESFWNQTFPNCDPYIKLDGIVSSELGKEIRNSPEPTKMPVFNCPICMEPFVEEVSTRCGHIFCKRCIKAALKAKRECPTCRVKVTSKGLIRVFLPSPGSP